MASVTHKCVYAGCFERNDGTNNNISFFKFPLKDVERTKIWQKNCGNIDILLMDITDLKQRVICQHHFAVEYIYQSGQRKLLRKNAVPLKFTQLTTDLGDIPPVCSTYVYCGTKRKRSTSDDCMVRSTPSPKRSSSSLSDISSFEINLPTKLETELTEKVKKLEYQVSALKKKCRQKNSRRCRRTTKNKKSATKFMLQVLLENKSK
ncbi:THAP domain-containing protein 1-like [Diabrotica virgifera virgifera]|uniref:THAP-type domain-containing protein n=1 Tax=Diabrotica virgifera virgifera TaxID=50390 RepID=A0ABM5K2B6_DIAVI|nr:THAP domain-containing protein 1-like [Diabrotica virgifera virgifera]